jgi:predicted nucleic acid-binding protein
LRVLFDSSVLVAAMVDAHPDHERARPWLERARAGRLEYLVAAHSLAEVYAVLSGLPTSPRISPGLAALLVEENVRKPATVVALGAADYGAVLVKLSGLGLAGGVVYDGLIARAAQKAKVDRLLTLNRGDFVRVWPEGRDVIAVP